MHRKRQVVELAHAFGARRIPLLRTRIAPGIERDDVLEGLELPVVKIRGCPGDVA
jgi:hypothetical protein